MTPHNRIRNIVILTLLVLGITYSPINAHAGMKEDLLSAKEQGLIGEQLDGMIGLVKPTGSQHILNLKKEVNAGRLDHYQKLSRTTNKPTSQIRLRFGKELTRATLPGFYIRNQKGNWVKQH